MNFKRFHESKNLFDYNAYFDSVFTPYNEFFNYAELQLQPNTTYTLSTSYREYAASLNRITAFIVATSNETPTTVSGGISNVTPITKTTESDGILKLYKRISGSYDSSIIPTEGQFEVDSWIMLNEGSTVLPYEPYGDTWHDTPHYIHNTSTDTLTTPADIYANDTTATVGLKGNMTQTGTPTPTTPIQPQETGDMSDNLTQNQKITSTRYNVTIVNNPLVAALKSIEADVTYTLSWKYQSNATDTSISNQIRLYNQGTTNLKTINNGDSFSLTSEQISALFQLICYFGSNNTDGYMDEFMLVEGSKAKDYEPYGQYKIPILSNSTTTPIYLGEVQSTRRIKKLVLTGRNAGVSTGDPQQGHMQRCYSTALRKLIMYCFVHILNPEAMTNYMMVLLEYLLCRVIHIL